MTCMRDWLTEEEIRQALACDEQGFQRWYDEAFRREQAAEDWRYGWTYGPLGVLLGVALVVLDCLIRR